MKLNTKASPKIYRLTVSGAPRRFIIDRKLASAITCFPWRFVPKMKRARATIKQGELREFLHRYVAQLAKKNWVEVFFLNNDPFDCRLENLAPYRRNEEGARRKSYKGKQVPYKGVYIKKGAKKRKYGASIRVNKKLIHLGYHLTAELAAEAYRKAFKQKHPNLTLN